MTNLCAVPTPSVVQLSALAHDAWDLARDDLESALTGAGAVLACWGIAGFTGDGRRWMRAQVNWFAGRALESGITTFWMVGGEPRHPSRWHQYVSDKYARTSGGTFDERIAQVLVQVPVQGQLN